MTTTRGGYHGRIQDLTLAECLELLASRSVGRVAFCTSDGPIVLPVNYSMYDGAVVFRTAPQNVIAQHVNERPTAFEVDDVDDFTESGWSVLVQGKAAFVDSVGEIPPDSRPEPWAEGTRVVIRVVPRSVTGRRVFAT